MNALMAEPATVLLVPKNRGLVEQVARALDQRDDVSSCSMRGEDIPYLANELARRGRRVLAFTGDDLVDEWIAAGNTLDQRLQRRRIRWEDPAAIYGAPALCLIGWGPFDSAQDDKKGGRIRVAVCARYRNLAERFLAACAGDGNAYELISIQGTLETMLLQGVADLIIDIVVTGRTIAEAGLRVLRVISTSDLAVLESRP